MLEDRRNIPRFYISLGFGFNVIIIYFSVTIGTSGNHRFKTSRYFSSSFLIRKLDDTFVAAHSSRNSCCLNNLCTMVLAL